MNKHLYRIVFNRVLGVLQVVAEIAHRPGGGGSTDGGPVAATLRPVSFALWLAMGLVGVVAPAAAQQVLGERVGRIVADPDAPGRHRPTVLETGGGVPVVNITTPSAAGVSRNVYSQFDVNAEGAILNNSRTQVQTQLAGWVQGNPWLATGTARVILNEVNSADPSYLHGYVEVAGDRAQVVIANPAGIQVDGGGFLNASRAALTTGKPNLEHGALKGYGVERGTIRVTGAGLDATHTDYTELIARSLQVNAGIWAQQLQVTTGVNTVSVDHTQVAVVTGTNTGAAPTLALDVSALGGMYAGKIALLGTEHGVGVRNAGEIGASAGELTVTVDGRLENTGAMQSKTDLRVNASGGVANAGTLSAARELVVTTPQDLDNRGTVNARRIEVEAASLSNRDGAIEQTGTQQLTLQADRVSNRDGGRIGVMASDAPNPGGDTPGTDGGNAGGGTGGETGGGLDGDDSGTGGSVTPPATLADGVLSIAGTLDNDGGRINAGGGVDLLTANGLDNSGGYLGLQRLTMGQGDLGNAGGELTVSGNAQIHVDRITNDGGRMEVAGRLQLEALTLSNRDGVLAHSGQAAAVRVVDTFDNTAGTFASNADRLTINAGVLVNEAGRIEHAGSQGLELNAGTLAGADGAVMTAGAAHLSVGQADHRGATLSAARVTLEAVAFDNRGGRIAASGTWASTLTASTLDNGDGGLIASQGDLHIQADTFGNADGTLQHAGKGDLTVAATTLDGAGGVIASNGILTLTGEHTDLRGGATSARQIIVDTGNLATADGTLIATGDGPLQLQVRGTLDNDGGMVATNGELELRAGMVRNRDGLIQAAGTGLTSVRITGGFDSSGGTLATAGDATVTAAELINAGGTLHAAGESTLQVTVEGLLDNSDDGLLAAGGDLSLTAGTLDNAAGRIEHAGEGELAIAANLLDGADGSIVSNGLLRLGGETTNLRGGTTRAQVIAIDTGSLTTADGSLIASGDGPLQLQVREVLDNDRGVVATNGSLQLSAGAVTNREGTLQAAGGDPTRVEVAGTLNNRAGTLASAGNATITARELLNAGGRVQAAGDSTLQVTVEGLLDNSAEGLIAAGGDMHLSADALDNTGGWIEHAGEGSLVIDATALNGTDGAILGNGALSLTGEHIDLSDGVTSAQRISIDTGTLLNAGGAMSATGTDVLALHVRDGFDNTAGTVATNGALELVAGAVDNRAGILQAAGIGQTQLRVAGTFDNRDGVLVAAGDTSVAATGLLNTGGRLQAVAESNLQVTVDGMLDNRGEGVIAAGGDLSLAADTLDNTSGRIEHAGEGGLTVDAVTLEGADGTIASNGTLTLTGETIRLQGGTTSGRSIAIDTGTLVTAGGVLIAHGDGPLRLQVRDTLDNDRGTLATGGALELAAGMASNHDGLIQAAGGAPTSLRIAGTFNNIGGVLTAAGDTTVTAGELLNAGGTVQAVGESGLQVMIDHFLDNSADGLLASGGDFALDAGMLDNTAGRIEHAGDGRLDIEATTLGGAGGTIASNGTLTVTGETTNLQGGSTSAQSITIDTGTLTTADGMLIASGDGPLRLQVRGTLDNDRGAVTTNGALELTAGTLLNREGLIQIAGGDPASLRVAGTFDNHSGTVISIGDTTIAAAELLNQSGILQATGASALQLGVDGLLDNSSEGRIAAGGDLSLLAETLDNTAGRVEHAGEGDLAINAATLDGAGGAIASNGALTLTGQLTNLRGGTTHARSIVIDTATLTTADGTLIASGDGPLRLQVRDSLDNDRGTVATNGALELTASMVSNRDGLIQVAGVSPSRIQVAEAFDNSGGTLAVAGDTAVTAAELHNVDGTLQTVDTASLQVTVAGLLDNRGGGLLASGGDMTLTAVTLDNRAGRIEHAGEGDLVLGVQTLDGAGGAVVSNGSLGLTAETVDLAGGETIARRIAVDAGTLVTADGALIATGTDTLDISVRGTFDNAAGTVATNGALALTAGMLDNRSGLIQAAGGDPASLRIASSFDNRDGVLATAGATTLHAGELLNTAGTVQSASDALLRVTSEGSLVNDNGTIEGNGDIALQTQSLSNRGGTVLAQQAIDAEVAGTLDNSGGSLIAGGDLGVRADNLLNRDTLDPAGQRGLIGAVVTLDAASSVDNSRGRIVASDGLILTSADLVNAGGAVDGTGTVTVQTVSFDNTAGSLIQRGAGGLVLDVSGTAINNAGLVGTEGAAAIQAGSFDNTGGTVFARDGLDMVSTGDLLNRDGGLLQSHAGMALEAGGSFDNSAGSVDAMGTVVVTASVIDNVDGQLLAGVQDDTDAGLRLVTSGTVDNRGGIIGSRGGDLDVAAAAIDNRAEGVLVAGQDLTLTAAAVDNAGGIVYAGRHLRYQNGTGTLDNTVGLFGAGDTAWLDLARINNSDGRIQAGTLWLTTTQLDNQGGEAGADILHAQIATLTGSGRLYGAQWLDLVFSGDFTYLEGERLESDGRLDLTVSGTFTNQGTLQSTGELSLTAGDVINEGIINASNSSGTGVNRISAGGTIDNRSGARIEGDTVALAARDVTNTGDIIGDVVGIEADTLTNGRDLGIGLAERDYGEGFIGAAGHLELRIGQRLSNLDAELFSGGELVIAGRTGNSRTGLLENVSGWIQAEGDVFAAADTVLNVRRVLDYEQRALTPEEQAAMTQVLAEGSAAGGYAETYQTLFDRFCDTRGSTCSTFDLWFYQETGTPTEGLFVTRASAGALLVSGGDMTLDVTTLRNHHSSIAAGRNLLINGTAPPAGGGDQPGVFNESLSGEQTWEVTAEYELMYQRCPDGLSCDFEPNEIRGTRALVTRVQTMYPEEGRATITAGNTVWIDSGGDVTNTVVNASEDLGGMGIGSVGGPGNTGLGSVTRTGAGAVDAVGPATGADVLVDTVLDGVQADGVGRTVAPAAAERSRVAGQGELQDTQTGPVTSDTTITAATGGQVGASAGAPVVTGDRINSTANPINTAPQLVGTPERPLPGLVPPDNGMFDRNADPDAPFLVTTAPRFVLDGTIGSDYLAGLLGRTTDLHKRLGDGYYEQRLVLEQLLQLTGRRTLDGSDGLTQYRTLMDNAAQTAAGLGLVLGAPLTAVQIASLDSDIVWLVEQEIDGQTVLVPVVYLSRASAERLRAEGALIVGADVGIRSAATVRNDGTMSATQGMWLSADTLINDGAITGTDRLAIAAAGDTLNRGQLSGGAVDIAAGRDFVQTSTGSLASTGSTVVAAGRDLSLEATTVTAGEHLVLGAGRDLSVTAKAGVQTVADGYTVATRETLQASELQAGGNLVLQAGRDATLQAAQLQAGDAVAIAVGRDLTLSTLTTTDTSLTDIDGRRFKQRTETLDETVHGTTVQAGGDIVMTAGRDATLTAAQVLSEEGGIAIAAGRDLTLAAAEETHRFEQDTVRKKSGLLSSKTTTTHAEVTDTYAIGTTLSGETVDLMAGRDFIATAAQVVGTGDVTIAAARDVTIEAGQDTHTESHSSQRKKSGLFGNGGLSVTLGSQRSANTVDVTETSHTGSLVGSLEGDTRIVAGQDVTIRGSTVSSPEGDIAIHGRSVNIEEVHDTSTYRQTSRSKQQGLTLAVSVPVVEAALTAYDSSHSVGESNDSRVNAMAAANAGYDSYQAAGTAATAMNSGQAVSISLTVGSQQSSSEASESSRDVVGSSINAGGRVDITATGAGDDSSIRISGSDVYGGTGASLHADGAIDILAAQNTYSQDSENHSSGWNAGLAATGGSGGWAAGITAGVNKGQGGSDGQTVTHTNAQVGSGGTTTLTSGGTTTIRGGQVAGERVEVDAGALAIESLQDTERYKSRQEDGSVQVTVGWGASVSGSYSQSKVDADYASVSEQSGILAGDGGYAVNVQGNTDLTGGIISSTDAAEAAGQNNVSTGTLTIRELENHARYKGTAFGLSGGVGKNGKGEQGQHQAAQGSGDGQTGGMSANKSFGFGRDDDSQSSTTSGGINTGNLTVTDVAGQVATGRTVEEIKADVTTTTTPDQLAENSGALANRFNAAAVQKELDVQVQVTQAFDQNRQEAKAELYAHAQAKADEARAIRMANGGVSTEESKRLDKEAARIKDTAMWLDIVAMGVYAGPDAGNLLTGETLTQIDLVRRAATPDSKIVVQTCESHGQSCVSREVDLGDVVVENGKIYVFNNGIFNSEEYALATGAKQNSIDASSQGVYYILNPYTGNPMTELLYAGYDKLNDLLGGILPLTGASRANQEIIDMAGKQGGEVNSVNHSRGSLTWTNAMHDFFRQGKTLLPIGTVLYNGAAANAQEAADLLLDISKAGKMFQSTHTTDLVGSWIGGNPITGGGSDGVFPGSHSSYTGYLPPFGTLIKIGEKDKYVDLREITDKNWGEGNYSKPKEVTPTQPRKEKEDENGG